MFGKHISLSCGVYRPQSCARAKSLNVDVMTVASEFIRPARTPDTKWSLHMMVRTLNSEASAISWPTCGAPPSSDNWGRRYLFLS